MTTEELVVLVAALVGAAICIGVLIGAFLFLRVRRKMDPLTARIEESGTEMTAASDFERIQFLTRLQALRPETQNFLEMLNDTRKKFHGKSSKGGDSKADSKHRAYRSILRDLSRILTLLNRKEEQIRTVPADWQRLLGWAERLLKRYKRQKISKEFGSAPHIEYLAPSGHGGSRRPRSAAGRLHSNGSVPAGSHFSISQAIIEEDDELDGIQSLPPIGREENHSRTAPTRGGAKYRKHEPTGRRRARSTTRLAPGGSRAHNASVPTGLHLLPEERAGKPVYVHQVNGGEGEALFVGDAWPRPSAGSLRPASSAHSLTGGWPAPPRSLPPGGGEEHPHRGPRPTYKDWPLEKLKHIRSARQERERTSDFTDTTTDGQSGHSGGSSNGMPPPPPPIYGNERTKPAGESKLDNSFNEHSDYIEKDIDSFSGRYFHEEELSTVL
ncbi:uncharacterized protein LOC122374880 isoform X2 [Amphibalanus amphitrite]|nr:uncharacterized protein LOC122374880 isoform X2 [Amphibalanus amphitrite]